MAILLEMSMSLDGFVAGTGVSHEQPMGRRGEELHDWMFAGKTSSESDAYERAHFAGIGAVIMGRRTADIGIGLWGEEPSFEAPCFVLTRRPHDTIVKRGGTSYTFVTDGPEGVLREARAAAGDKDILVMGGAEAAQHFLRGGWIERVAIHLVPVLLGDGARLFDRVGDRPIALEQVGAEPAAGVTHLTYRVRAS